MSMHFYPLSRYTLLVSALLIGLLLTIFALAIGWKGSVGQVITTNAQSLRLTRHMYSSVDDCRLQPSDNATSAAPPMIITATQLLDG